jgi:hypothetical protein
MTVHGSTTSEREVRDNDYAGVANVLKALGGRRVHIAPLISKLHIFATSAHPLVAAPLRVRRHYTMHPLFCSPVR